MRRLKYFLKSIVNEIGIDVMPYDYRYSVQNFLNMIFKKHKIQEIWDIGANRGQYASMCRLLGYKNVIVSVEPMPSEIQILKQISSKDKKWKVIGPLAITKKEGKKFLNVTENTAESSFLHPLGSEVVKRIEVNCKTLKKVFESENIGTQNFLKLDVQGSELDCLQSAGNILQNFIFIQCEASITPLYKNERSYLDIIN